jgi:hypothetical protein
MTAKLLTPKTPFHLGELLCAAGLVQQAQLDAALQLQNTSGEKIGAALRHQAHLDPKDVAAALVVQQQLRERLSQEAGKATHALPTCLRMGELLVARGDVTRAVLDQALAQQQPHRLLGEVLLQMGAVSADTLAQVLPLQKRLLSAVLCAGLGFAFAFASPAALAAGSSTSRIMISATIPTTLHVSIKGHPAGFTVSAQDISRGYVDVAQQSLFDVKTNSAQGVALEFHGVQNGVDIETVQIQGGAGEFRMPASGGIMLIQGGWQPTVVRSFTLRYRLYLGPSAQPGTHSWPLTMGVSAL